MVGEASELSRFLAPPGISWGSHPISHHPHFHISFSQFCNNMAKFNISRVMSRKWKFKTIYVEGFGCLRSQFDLRCVRVAPNGILEFLGAPTLFNNSKQTPQSIFYRTYMNCRFARNCSNHTGSPSFQKITTTQKTKRQALNATPTFASRPISNAQSTTQ